MKSKLPNISEAIKKKDILSLYNNNFQLMASDWFELKVSWLTQSYKNFKDHDKYLILIYIVKKTMDYYSENFVNLSFNEFYNIDKIEIEKFNIIDISKNLGISKETARRKVTELQIDGVIQKNKKKLLVKRDAFKFQKPVIILKHISVFLKKVSKSCAENKILEKEFTHEQIEKTIDDKFSHIWRLWYDMLIPGLIEWKKIFSDLESYHIFGTIVLNQTYEINKYLSKKKFTLKNRMEFANFIYSLNDQTGVNALTLSNLTGIPRATVIRKLKILIKKKFLYIDQKKLYHTNKKNFAIVLNGNDKVIKRLSHFTTQIFNLTKFN